MKKTLCALLAALLALGLLGCAAPAAQPAPPEAAAAREAVVFADPVLERMVRASMGKPEGDITAAEAEAVTGLNLSLEWQRYISEETPIQDIGGLESFKNLESLDLSYHAIADIAPLAGLKKLTSLSLGGNPIADIAPLSGLTNLKILVLSGCAAQDYSPLAALIHLEFLALDRSAIADLSPLAALTSLTRLYLAGCPVGDYSPLANVYPSLKEKDFIMASTLAELGFTLIDNGAVAGYKTEEITVTINHSRWGAPAMEAEINCVKLYLQLDSEYTLIVMYYPEIGAYVFQMIRNGEMTMNYIYDPATGEFTVDASDREDAERVITAALGETNAEDILLAPIPLFRDTIQRTLGMTADALYALPFEPPTLGSFGFGFATDEDGSAAYAYHEHEPHDMHISIYRSPWGVSRDSRNIEFYDHDFNGYNLLILYFADEGRYNISLRKDEAACSFDSYPAAGEKGGESPDLDTVRRVFNDAFGTQGDGFYDQPLTYFERFVQDRFGMSVEKLYALPVGE